MLVIYIEVHSFASYGHFLNDDIEHSTLLGYKADS